MKIIQIVQSISNLSAGPTYSVGSLAHYLTLKNHDTQLFALGEKPPKWPYTVTLKLFNDKLTKAGLLPISAWLYIRNELACAPAIVHVHGVWRILNLLPLITPKNNHLKWVWSPRGMFSQWSWNYKSYIKRPFWYLLQKPALKHVDCFHATSHEEFEDIRRLGFKQPVALIPNGVEIPLLENLAQNKENKIVFLSRIHTKKGLHLLIPAWQKLSHQFPNWRLIIAGKMNSPYAEDMKALAKQLNTPRIEFIGETIGKEKNQLLSSARVFVLPSFSENFGIAIAEALAHKTAVITTIHTPWHSLEEKECGWCIPANEESLIKTLKQALSTEPEQLDQMGENGRTWMEHDFSWPVIAEKFEALYEWLIKKSHLPNEVQLD